MGWVDRADKDLSVCDVNLKWVERVNYKLLYQCLYIINVTVL